MPYNIHIQSWIIQWLKQLQPTDLWIGQSWKPRSKQTNLSAWEYIRVKRNMEKSFVFPINLLQRTAHEFMRLIVFWLTLHLSSCFEITNASISAIGAAVVAWMVLSFIPLPWGAPGWSRVRLSSNQSVLFYHGPELQNKWGQNLPPPWGCFQAWCVVILRSYSGLRNSGCRYFYPVIVTRIS